MASCNELDSDEELLREEFILNAPLTRGPAPKWQPKTPSAIENPPPDLKVAYTFRSWNAPLIKKTPKRFLTTTADRIFHVPGLVDGCRTHPVDWSCNNVIAVARGDVVCVSKADNWEMQRLADLTDDGNELKACSVSWIEKGNHLAVGVNNGEIWLLDAAVQRRVRCMHGHTSSITCLCWNEHVLSSGSAEGLINHYDVRVADFLASSIPRAHDGLAVCGLAWSPDRRYLASCGADNAVKVWGPGEAAGGRATGNGPEPFLIFTRHSATVKAIAWCPWKPNILASGGGTNDGTLRIWNVASGLIQKETVVAQSQISALAWSEKYKEVISAHGEPSNELMIWSYPSLEKVATLTGHNSGVLDMAMSPDKTAVITAAGSDETLRVWKCFATDTEDTEEKKNEKALNEA